MTDIGDGVRIGNHAIDPATAGQTGFQAFTVAGAATDPTTVELTIRKPDGTFLEYGWPSAGANGTLTKESVGRFYFDVLIDLPGKWSFRLAGTGVAAAAVEGLFVVQRQKVIAP